MSDIQQNISRSFRAIGSDDFLFSSRKLALFFKSHTTATIFHKLLFWRDYHEEETGGNGSFYNTDAELAEQCACSIKSFRYHRDKLKRAGYIQTTVGMINQFKTTYYWVDLEAFASDFVPFLNTKRKPKNEVIHSQNPFADRAPSRSDNFALANDNFEKANDNRVSENTKIVISSLANKPDKQTNSRSSEKRSEAAATTTTKIIPFKEIIEAYNRHLVTDREVAMREARTDVLSDSRKQHLEKFWQWSEQSMERVNEWFSWLAENETDHRWLFGKPGSDWKADLSYVTRLETIEAAMENTLSDYAEFG